MNAREGKLRVDVTGNRSSQKWTRKQLFGRILWSGAELLFRLSPRPFWWIRNCLLRTFGAEIGRDVRIFPSVRVTIPWNIKIGDGVGIGDRAILYALGSIIIEDRATVSQGAHLCAGSHDLRDPMMRLLKEPIHIRCDAWVCADAFVGPGVVVGERSIVGARGVVVRDVAPDTVVAGNPATKVSIR